MELLQVASELEQAVELYRAERPARVLEIGCWDGGTLRVWLTEHAPDLVVAADLEHRNQQAYEEWRDARTRLEVVVGDSQGGETLQRVRELAPYDWAFVDGDHGDWYAKADTMLALECAAPGGLVLIHDIVDCYSEGPAVAFKEAAEGRQSWSYVDAEKMRWGHGIGVVRVGA